MVPQLGVALNHYEPSKVCNEHHWCILLDYYPWLFSEKHLISGAIKLIVTGNCFCDIYFYCKAIVEGLFCRNIYDPKGKVIGVKGNFAQQRHFDAFSCLTISLSINFETNIDDIRNILLKP